MVKLFRKNSNLCDHNPPTSQTDRWTDRRHAIARPRTALTSASCGKNLAKTTARHLPPAHNSLSGCLSSAWPIRLLWLGLLWVLEYYSSSKPLGNFLLLEYSLISISGCKFPFPVAVFLQTAVNWWIVRIYGNLGLRDFICNLPACRTRPKRSAQQYGSSPRSQSLSVWSTNLAYRRPT